MAAGHREVVWSQRARDALDEAVAYVWKDAPERARQLLERILNAAATLDRLSDRGCVVPELADPTYRELLVRPYRLIYDARERIIVIVALLHEARDFATWRREQSSF